MTSVLMIFETTQDYAVIVPLMISNLISFFISSRLQPEPIYDALAYQDGIHLPSAATRQQRGGRQVAYLMQPPKETLPAEISVGDALQMTLNSNFHCWPVCDKTGVIGVLNQEGLQRAAEQYGKEKQLGELVDARMFPHLHADQSLHLALERMGGAGLDLLPVVSRADVHKLEGISVTPRCFDFLRHCRQRSRLIPFRSFVQAWYVLTFRFSKAASRRPE